MDHLMLMLNASLSLLMCKKNCKKVYILDLTEMCICHYPGPRGADGQPIRKLIDYFSSSSPHFQIEMRPNKRVQPNNQKLDSSELNENNIPGTKRMTGEESWTKIKPVKLDPKLARAMKDNLGADVKEHKATELHEVKQINPSVFIGMDVVKVGFFRIS